MTIFRPQVGVLYTSWCDSEDWRTSSSRSCVWSERYFRKLPTSSASAFQGPRKRTATILRSEGQNVSFCSVLVLDTLFTGTILSMAGNNRAIFAISCHGYQRRKLLRGHEWGPQRGGVCFTWGAHHSSLKVGYTLEIYSTPRLNVCITVCPFYRQRPSVQ